MKSATALLLVCGLAVPSRAGATQAPVDDSQGIRSRVSRYLGVRARQPDFSAAVLVVSNNKVLLRDAFGKADFELGTPLTPNQVFRIGSLTKPFTATGVLWLRDQGRLDLSRSICDFLQGCPPEWREVTIEHLLSHTSGIPDLFGDLEAVPVAATRAEVDRVVRKGGAFALKAAVGSKYAYSNFNYVLLGYAIEVVTGQPWETFLLANVIGPAKLSETRYDDVWAVVPGRVHGYEIKEGRLRITRYTDHAAYAAGGLNSTLDDLQRWHEAYWSGQILSKPSIEDALRPRLGEYGLGWQITTHFGHPLHNHSGGVRGFASHIAFYPGDGLLVVVLSNIENEDTKATACDIAALAFNVTPAPTGTPEWLKRSRGDRCGTSLR